MFPIVMLHIAQLQGWNSIPVKYITQDGMVTERSFYYSGRFYYADAHEFNKAIFYIQNSVPPLNTCEAGFAFRCLSCNEDYRKTVAAYSEVTQKKCTSCLVTDPNVKLCTQSVCLLCDRSVYHCVHCQIDCADGLLECTKPCGCPSITSLTLTSLTSSTS
jgi:hypothetical protein